MSESSKWLIGAGKGRRQVRILFTCAGRRVELIQAFQRACKSLTIRSTIHASDTEPHFAAGQMADKAHQVPPISSKQYVPRLIEITKREKIDLVIPLIDVELLKLADARDRFAAFECGVVISAPRVIKICRDKLNTYAFLREHEIDTPETWTADEIMKRRRHTFPYFLKPRRGSASKGNFVLRNRDDLESFVPRVPDAIIQRFAEGNEYTLDVYTGFDGVPRCAVPRRRLEVRGGEVTKAETFRHQGIIKTGIRVAEALRDCVGLITIQLFLAPNGRIRVIEVNPRFGGGVPLAIQAGADFPKWLIAEWLGNRPRIRNDHFRDRMVMLRYHQSFFETHRPTRKRR